MHTSIASSDCSVDIFGETIFMPTWEKTSTSPENWCAFSAEVDMPEWGNTNRCIRWTHQPKWLTGRQSVSVPFLAQWHLEVVQLLISFWCYVMRGADSAFSALEHCLDPKTWEDTRSWLSSSPGQRLEEHRTHAARSPIEHGVDS